MSTYSVLLKQPAISRLLLIGFVARLPQTVISLVLMFHVKDTMGLGYGWAGLAIAAFTIGVTIGGPWRGHRLDSVGLRKALIPSIVAEVLVWSIAPWLPLPGLMVAAFIGGLLTLPIFTVMRQSLAAMSQGPTRRAAFSLDSIATEFAFMIGPMIGTLVAVFIGTVPALIAMGALTALGGVLIYAVNPPLSSLPDAGADPNPQTGALGIEAIVATETPEPEGTPAEKLAPAKRSMRQRFGWITLPLVLVYVVALGAAIVLSGTEVGIVSSLKETGQEVQVGWVFLFWCLGSAIGGVIYGATKRHISATVLLLLMSATTLLLALSTDIVFMSAVSMLPGLFCAPVLAAASERVAEIVPERYRGKAMGLYGSSLTIGTAVGSPLAGVFADGFGPGAGFLAAGIGGLAVCALVTGIRFLDARHPTTPAARVR